MAKKIISEVEKQLRIENQKLKARLYETELTLNAIRNGEVEAFVIEGALGKTIYSLASTETPYRVIIEEMCEGAATLLEDGTICYCNHRFAELVSIPHEEVIGANINHFFTEKEKERLGVLMKTGLEKSCNGEILYLTSEGDERYLYISFSPLPPNLLGDVCILISDITDRKKTEQVLKDSEEMLRITISSIQDPVFITNDTGIFTFICSNVFNLLEYTPHEIKQMGNISSIVGDHLFDINDLNTHGIITNIKQTITNKSGIELDFLITVSRVSVLGGTILYVCHDITELKTSRQSLKESETNYRELIENSPDAIVIYAQGKVVLVNNEAVNQMRASSRDELIGKEVIQFVHPDYKEFAMERMKKMTKREAVMPIVEEKFIRLDGSQVVVEVKAISIMFENKPAVQLIIRDITERRKAEEIMSTSLKEKETLLHEIHHRVRNNLQAIIALVSIRARLTHDAETFQFLTDLENQTYAMALVYDQLHQSENLAQIGMAQYLLKLTTNVIVTYGRSDSIQLHLDAPLTMDMEHAAPCGLIVNELFSNILKHAFPPGFRGKPTVSIVLKQDDKAYHLTVSDNGVGIPPGYDWHKSQSMGLHLVNLWVTLELGGTLAVSGKSGTTFTITFNLKD